MKRSLPLLFVPAVGLVCSLVWAGVPETGPMTTSPDQTINRNAHVPRYVPDACASCVDGSVCPRFPGPPHPRQGIVKLRTYQMPGLSGIPPCEPAGPSPCEPMARTPCEPACDFRQEICGQSTKSPLFRGRVRGTDRIGRLIVRRLLQ